MVRPANGSKVRATLYSITRKQRDRIAEWELVPFGWFREAPASVIDGEGEKFLLNVEQIGDNQTIDRIVNGLVYEPYLVAPELILDIARKARSK